MVGVLAGLGWLFGGATGVLWSVAFAVVLAALLPSPSPARWLRASGARPLHRFELFDLQRAVATLARSEERRVGKECRSRWSPYH